MNKKEKKHGVAKPWLMVPTLKEVADIVGVSTATASRALSGLPGLRESLRAEIFAAARSISYHPNRAARDLRVRSSRAVGLLIPDIQNPFFTSLVCGIEDVLAKTDYSLLLASHNEDPDQESRRLEVFRADGVAGLIFAASRTPSRLYAEIGKSGRALVAVSRDVPKLQIDQVTVANQEGARSVVSHLIQLGHKRIAIVNGPLVFPTARDRQAGYEHALRDAGIALEKSLIAHCAFKQAEGHSAMQQVLDSTNPPTAVFAASNLLTLGTLQAIHERHLRIPDEIAVVGFDEMPWAMSLRPPLTTVGQPAFEVGRTAAELFLSRVREPGLPRRQVVLGTKLIVRSSCGSKSKRLARKLDN